MKNNNRYDENLNDHKDSIISHLQNKLHKANKFFISFGVLVVLLMIALGIMISVLNDSINENKQYKAQIVKEEAMLSLEYSIGYWFINNPNEVNDTILYDFLKENGAWYPDILLKQAKIESGNYTSAIYKTGNNLYGMRRVYKRQTTQSGGNKGYGTYNNWCLSVLDRLLWDMFTFKNEKPSRKDYLKAMEVYAEDPDYIKKLQ